MAEYEIWYSDPYGRGRRRLAEWSRLVASRRLNRVGQLRELLLPVADAPAMLTVRDARIEIWRDGRLLMDTLYLVRRFSFTERGGVSMLRLGGYDPLYLLDGRIVAAASGSAAANKSGHADDVIKAYVRENFGSLTVDEDRDASLYLTVADDSGQAPVIERRAARQNLGRLIRGICFESAQRGMPLYVDLVLRADGLLELQTFAGVRGVDHRRNGLGPVAISVELGTLAESERVRDYADKHTYVYVGGRGLRDQRTVVEVQDPARSSGSPWGRREIWFDARHLSTEEALEAAGSELLWQGLPDERIVGVAGAGFAERWGFGDLIEAGFVQEVAECRIDECEITVEADRSEKVIVGLYELAAESALLSVAQRVDDIGVQESPEYSELPLPYAVPLADGDGKIADDWLHDTIARISDIPTDIVDHGELYAEAAARLAGDNAEASARGAHAVLTTAAHGGIVASTDARLSDARTPLAHNHLKASVTDLETITATPTPNAVPKAGTGGTIADGWLSALIARLTAAGYLWLGGTGEEFLYARGTIDVTTLHLFSDHGPGTYSHAYFVSGETGITWQAALASFNWHPVAGVLGRKDTSIGAAYVRMTPGLIDLDVVSAAGADSRMVRINATGVMMGGTANLPTRSHTVEHASGNSYTSYNASGEKFVIGIEHTAGRFIFYSNTVGNYPIIILYGGAVGIGKSPGITNFGDLDVAGRLNVDGGIVSQAWQALTLQNGWANFGSGYNTAGYWKDSYGVVHLRGVIRNGTTTPGTVLFNLPAGYRPPGIELLPALTYTTSHVLARVDIFSTGNGVIQFGGNAFLALDGLSFRTY